MSPSPPTPSQNSVDCAEATVRMRAISSGSLDALRLRELRKHLATCPECMDAYREAMQTTAILGRRGAADREQRGVQRARHNLHAEHFGPTREVIRHRRYYNLRMVLIPAFAIVLMVSIAGIGKPPVRVDLVSADGVVKLSGRAVLITEKPLLVLPGRWLSVGKFSKASVDVGKTHIRMGDRTECLLVRARPLELRLRRGQLDVEGDLVIYTVLGMLQVTGGKGRVVFGNTGFRLDPESGSWHFLDSRGKRDLPLGETTTVPPTIHAQY